VILTGPLDSQAIAAARSVVEAAAAADGVSPLSEQARLNLGNPGWTHLRAVRSETGLTGYAQLDPDGTGELVVHPEHRRRGVGRTLLDRLLAAGARRVWAHGDLPAAAALARSARLQRVRSLWQLARPLTDPLPEPELPAGVAVRSFEPGRDDAAWLALNSAAFATHPEQGRWTDGDLAQRLAEPWFDPAGFYVAFRDDRMVGFHWTKIEDRAGEVYVLGVHPSEQGTGLGRALTLVGLRHLRERGLDQVTLYVEEDNVAAVGLYTSLGFAKVAADVQYGTTTGV
jgi:mycothiol synthase